jgi:hypothetical protein
MLKPGKNDTSWQPGWNHGKTQMLRVPIALAPQILDYARALDSGINMKQQIILQFIDQFVEVRKSQFHPNQYSRTASLHVRRWDELRKFREMIATDSIAARSGSTPESVPVKIRH